MPRAAQKEKGKEKDEAFCFAFREALLRWYDSHRRVMPWRAEAGTIANPYHVWLSEVMLQQTTVPAVVPYFLKFVERWPDVCALANAQADEIMQLWAGLGYYSRARNLHRCANIIAQKDGVFPQEIKELCTLPGIGDYTANAIRAIAFNKPANVVDGNVERVMARIFCVEDPLPASKKNLKSFAAFLAETEKERSGDYAQALMDLGAGVCIPRSPRCGVCPVSNFCKAREKGIAPRLPVRAPREQKPQKFGYVYWITHPKTKAVLFEKRQETGLLAGTIGLPTSQWSEKKDKSLSPATIRVKHSFTHFNLELEGVRIQATNPKNDPLDTNGEYFWVSPEDIEPIGVPSLFRKAIRIFREEKQ